MVITIKHEGYGFPWYIQCYRYLNHMSSSHEILSYVPTTSKGSTRAASTGTLSLQLPWKWHPRFFVQARNEVYIPDYSTCWKQKDWCSRFLFPMFFQRCDFQVPMLVFEGAGKDFTIAGFFQCSRWGFGSDHRVLKFLFLGNNGPVLCSLLATTASLLAGLPGIWSSRWGVKALKRPRIEAMVRANQAATSHENTQPDQCTELRRTYFEWWCSISLGQVLPGPGCVNFNIGIGACKQLLLSEESSDRGAIRAGRALW